MARVGDLHTTVALEVDEFELALPHMRGSLVRTGTGDRASRLVMQGAAPITTLRIDVGFPLCGTVDTADDTLVLAIPFDLETPALWDGVDVRPGQVFVYPPGGQQQLISPTGMTVGAVIVPIEALERTADELGRTSRRLRHTVVSVEHGSTLVDSFRTSVLTRSAPFDEHARDELLAEVVKLVTDPHPETGGSSRLASSRRIASTAVDLLEATGQWRPSIPELCRTVGTSERRLQLAFRDVFDMTPVEFLRTRALSAVRRELVRANAQTDEVTRIAQDHGFRHLGRFAVDYRATFGESPSATLRSGHPGPTPRTDSADSG